MIENEHQLIKAAEDAGALLQQIQDYLRSKNHASGKVRFPRGFIRSASEIRSELPSLDNGNLISNISYAVMMTDVLRWLAIRTDISSTAKSMIVKEAICILGSICESFTKYVLRGRGSAKKFTDRTQILVDMEVIDSLLKDEVDWIWDVRSKEHLWEIDGKEHDRYSAEDYNRALKAYSKFRKKLKGHFG